VDLIAKTLRQIVPIFLVLLLAACDPKTVMEEQDSKAQAVTGAPQKQLTMRITWKTYSGRGEAIRRIAEQYNSSNGSGYRIVLADGDENIDNIEARMDTKDSADIYVLPYRYVKYLGHKGKLEELTGSFGASRDLFYEEIWNLGIVGQKLYGVPWLGHSMALIYNKELLDKAGVDPAAVNSPESLAAACKQVMEKTDAWGIGLVGADHNDVSWMVNQFIYGFGGSLINSQGTAVTINSENARSAIEFYRDELGRYAQDTWKTDTGVEVMEYFRKQQLAFEIQSLWGVTDIWKNGRPFVTGVIPMEQIGLNSEVGPMMLALGRGLNEDEKAEAVLFIKYLVSKQAQEMIMDGEYSPEHDAYYPFRLPVRKDVGQSIVTEKYPELAVFMEGFKKPSIDVPVAIWQSIKEEYYAPGLHLVMTGELPVEKFLQDIQDRGNALLKQTE